MILHEVFINNAFGDGEPSGQFACGMVKSSPKMISGEVFRLLLADTKGFRAGFSSACEDEVTMSFVVGVVIYRHAIIR